MDEYLVEVSCEARRVIILKADSPEDACQKAKKRAELGSLQTWTPKPNRGVVLNRCVLTERPDELL